MSEKQFISNLSATYADIRKLDVKKINLKGKNILEYIKESVPVILDERGTNADATLDIWNSYVTKDEFGNVIINRSEIICNLFCIENNRSIEIRKHKHQHKR